MTAGVFAVAVLLLLGVGLRQRVRWLRLLLIPGSVVAGFLGLGFVSLLAGWGGEAAEWADALCSQLAGWPGPMIAVVFAAMMLQQPGGGRQTRDAAAAGRVAREGLMVWIIVLGQTMVGLWATWWLIQPRYDVPNSFGILIETGFAGGHGTAAAMGQVLRSEEVGLAAGLDLGLLMATCGLVYGVVSGIFWINIASRRGWLSGLSDSPARDRGDHHGAEPIGFATVSTEAIDPLLLQVVWIVLAVAAGVLMQSGVLWVAAQIDAAQVVSEGISESPQPDDPARAELSKRLSAGSVMDFPLFIYTLFGGWTVRRLLRAFGKSHWVDSATVARISSTAMEVLVVAAITSLQLSAVAALAGPFLILFLAGAVWTAICLMVLSRQILPPEHWFPLGLINYGMSTGTTATGFVLLRVVDPNLRTAAASDYALAAPLSAPFVGGGMLTIALPLVVLERVPIQWSACLTAIVVATLIVVGILWSRRALRGGSPSG